MSGLKCFCCGFFVFYSLSVMGQIKSSRIDYSSERQDSSMWNKQVKIKRDRKGLMDDVTSILTVGVGSNYILQSAINGFYSLDNLDLKVGYQRKVFMPALVLDASLKTHAFMLRERYPDISNEVWDGYLKSKMDADFLLAADLKLKYFPFLSKKMKREVSGNHVFGPYVSLAWVDAFSVTRETYKDYFYEGELARLLQYEEEVINTGFDYGQLFIRLGYQQRVFKKLLVEAEVTLLTLMDYRELNVAYGLVTQYETENFFNLSLSYILKQ
jgi:hypothetical protein